MFVVVQPLNKKEIYGKVVAKFDCRYKAKQFIDNTNESFVICVSNCKIGTHIRNHIPTFNYGWHDPERNPDPKQAVLLFSYS